MNIMLNKVTSAVKIENMKKFCRDNNLSYRSFTSKKDRELEKGNKIFPWMGYIVQV